MRKLVDNLRNTGNYIHDNFHIKEAAIAGLTVTGSVTLYLSIKDVFIYDSLNKLSFGYGIGAVSAVLAYYTNNFIEDMKAFREVVKYAKEQKSERKKSRRDK